MLDGNLSYSHVHSSSRPHSRVGCVFLWISPSHNNNELINPRAMRFDKTSPPRFYDVGCGIHLCNNHRNHGPPLVNHTAVCGLCTLVRSGLWDITVDVHRSVVPVPYSHLPLHMVSPCTHTPSWNMTRSHHSTYRAYCSSSSFGSEFLNPAALTMSLTSWSAPLVSRNVLTDASVMPVPPAAMVPALRALDWWCCTSSNNFGRYISDLRPRSRRFFGSMIDTECFVSFFFRRSRRKVTHDPIMIHDDLPKASTSLHRQDPFSGAYTHMPVHMHARHTRVDTRGNVHTSCPRLQVVVGVCCSCPARRQKFVPPFVHTWQSTRQFDFLDVFFGTSHIIRSISSNI